MLLSLSAEFTTGKVGAVLFFSISIPAFARRLVNIFSPTPLAQTKSHWLQRWMGLISSFCPMGQETYFVMLQVTYGSDILPGPSSLFQGRFPVSQTASHLNRHRLPSHHAGGTISTHDPALSSPYLLSRSQGHSGSKEVVFKPSNSYSFIRAAMKPALPRSKEEILP